MRYQAPNSGIVNWRTKNYKPKTMTNGQYQTPQAGPQPVGWGGNWSASQIASQINHSHLLGGWDLSGSQTNVPRSNWEASLVLNNNGTLTWKETKGANVGATREGRWILVKRNSDNKVYFVMIYRAPNSWVTWTTVFGNVTATQMTGGKYQTPQDGPQPVGWGGEWSGRKRG